MQPATRAAIADALSSYDSAVELAVGQRPGVAGTLADRGVDVTATDLRERQVPEDVTFAQDDLTDPDLSIYEGAGVLYGLNLPAELQRPAAELSEEVGASLYFTTLGAEQPVIPVDRETLPGETLFAHAPVGGT